MAAALRRWPSSSRARYVWIKWFGISWRTTTRNPPLLPPRRRNAPATTAAIASTATATTAPMTSSISSPIRYPLILPSATPPILLGYWIFLFDCIQFFFFCFLFFLFRIGRLSEVRVQLLQSLTPCASVAERNLLADTSKIVEKNNKTYKRKDDLRKTVTDGLIALGYNASLCKSKWDKSSSIPAGNSQFHFTLPSLFHFQYSNFFFLSCADWF